jgi:hypothetical protein
MLSIELGVVALVAVGAGLAVGAELAPAPAAGDDVGEAVVPPDEPPADGDAVAPEPPVPEPEPEPPEPVPVEDVEPSGAEPAVAPPLQAAIDSVDRIKSIDASASRRERN